MNRPPSSPPELPGYDYIRLLGAGGFSDVFLYEQHLPRRRVAVKVLLADALSSANRAAFVAEANVMAQLSSHPYIVTIHHAGVAADDRPFLVMEYMPGATLAERYKRAPLSAEEVLRTGVRLSSAIATAHAAGILHRDIKPANVLSNDFGWPALTDFGIAQAAHDGAPAGHGSARDSLETDPDGTTQSRSIGLSVPWSPSEMFDDDPRPDVRSDVFSLAATIYTLLAGHTPFEQRGRPNGTVDLMGRIERGELTPLHRDDVPMSLVAVLRKGMDVDRSRRFASAVDFARALQRVELELGFAPTPIDVPNLLVEETREVDDSDEATRLRGVAVVDAQPVALARPAAPASPAADATQLRQAPVVADPEPQAGMTVLRPRTMPTTPPPTSAGAAAAPPPEFAPPPPTVPPPPTAGTSLPAPSPPPTRPRRLGLLLGIVGGAVAVVAAIVVTAVLLSSGILAAPDPGPTSTAGGNGDGGGGAIVGDSIPFPNVRDTTWRAEDETLIVEVENPDYRDGDVFRWYRLSNPGRTSVVDSGAATAVIEVPDVPDGTQTCIAVIVQRSGQLSPATEVCHP